MEKINSSSTNCVYAQNDMRRLRWRVRRIWNLPAGYRLATPAFSGIFLLTIASLGTTLASWVMVRLLPNMALISAASEKLPNNFLEFLKKIPELLDTSLPSTIMVTGALISQEAYIITYACSAATAFCFLLLLCAFICRW